MTDGSQSCQRSADSVSRIEVLRLVVQDGLAFSLTAIAVVVSPAAGSTGVSMEAAVFRCLEEPGDESRRNGASLWRPSQSCQLPLPMMKTAPD